MRLPWPFGRHSTEGPSAAAGAPADGLAPEAGPDTADPAVAPLAPPTGAWARLPAIQRTVGDVPVVAPARPFLAGVPGARPLPPIVEPLGHEVTPLAPAGLIAAPPSPVASLTSHVPLTPRPVQRHVERARRRGRSVDDVERLRVVGLTRRAGCRDRASSSSNPPPRRPPTGPW